MKAWLTALGLSLLACWLLAALAPVLRLVDQPDARKQHEGAIPVVGGLAIMFGFVVATRLAGIAGNFAAIALPVGIALALGVLDDARGVAARHKLWVQVAAVWLLVKTSGLAFQTFPLPGADLSLGVMAVPFTVFVGVGLLNAVNTIDGLDGLCGGLLMVGLLLLAGVATAVDDAPLARIAMLLQAAVCGFWLLNVRLPWQPRAHAFLGDAGAFGVAMLMLWFMLTLSGGSAPRAPWPLVLAACWLPVTDLLTVSMIRMRAGRSPFAADRLHFHHLLLRMGLGHGTAAAVAWALAAVVGGGIYLMWRDGMSGGALLLAMLGASTVFAVRVQRAWRTLSDDGEGVSS